MKKMIATSLPRCRAAYLARGSVLISTILPVLSAFAQMPDYLSYDTNLKIPTKNLSVESVSFQPLEIVTNRVESWEPYTLVVTNPPWVDNGSIITNEVHQQILTDVVSTNAARWTITVLLTLRNHWFDLDGDGKPGLCKRLDFEEYATVSQEAVTALFGPAAAGLEFAAQNGAYKPTGQVKDGFLSLSAQVLGGAQ